MDSQRLIMWYDVNTKDVFFQAINIEPLIILTFCYLSLPLSETLSSVFNEQKRDYYHPIQLL